MEGKWYRQKLQSFKAFSTGTLALKIIKKQLGDDKIKINDI